MRVEVNNISYECVPEGQPSTVYSSNGANCPVTGEDVLAAAEVSSLSIGMNVLALLAYAILTRLLGYFALKFLNAKHTAFRR